MTLHTSAKMSLIISDGKFCTVSKSCFMIDSSTTAQTYPVHGYKGLVEYDGYNGKRIAVVLVYGFVVGVEYSLASILVILLSTQTCLYYSPVTAHHRRLSGAHFISH